MLYTILFAVLALFALLFCAALFVNFAVFGKRFELDGEVPLYTQEEFRLQSEAAAFKCGKNTLRGNFYFYEGCDAGKIVVYAHGMFSSHKSYMQDIAFLCKSGFAVLGFDYTGTDMSQGKNLVAMSNSIRCLDRAVDFAKARFPQSGVYVVGHSWGGFAVCNIAKHQPDVKAVVALAPIVKLPNAFHLFLKGAARALLPFELAVEFAKCGKYAFANGEKALKNFAGKALVIASLDDNVVSYAENAAPLVDALPNVRVLSVENKKHYPHYTSKAANSLNEYVAKSRALKGEELSALKRATNFHALGELDEGVMQKIADFLRAN